MLTLTNNFRVYKTKNTQCFAKFSFMNLIIVVIDFLESMYEKVQYEFMPPNLNVNFDKMYTQTQTRSFWNKLQKRLPQISATEHLIEKIVIY